MLALDLFRYNARLKALTFAIGVCVAFIVGSFAFANGLSSTVENITTKFESEGALAFEGDDLSSSLIDLSQLNAIRSYAAVGLCVATVNTSGDSKIFIAVNDPGSTLQQNFIPPEGEILVGSLESLDGLLLLSSSEGDVELWANQTYSSALFPAYWNLIRWEDLLNLRTELEGKASFLIFNTVDSGLVSSLQSQGLSVQEMTGILSYFSAGSEEVETDLWLIIIPSSFVVAMLVYSAVAMEAKDRTREIAILKTMGASNRKIGGIFLFQATILSILGGLTGIMIGIIVAYLISTSSSIVIESSLFYLRVTEYSMLVAFLSSVIAGLAGSLVPIYRATHLRVREALK